MAPKFTPKASLLFAGHQRAVYRVWAYLQPGISNPDSMLNAFQYEEFTHRTSLSSPTHQARHTASGAVALRAQGWTLAWACAHPLHHAHSSFPSFPFHPANQPVHVLRCPFCTVNAHTNFVNLLYQLWMQSGGPWAKNNRTRTDSNPVSYRELKHAHCWARIGLANAIHELEESARQEAAWGNEHPGIDVGVVKGCCAATAVEQFWRTLSFPSENGLGPEAGSKKGENGQYGAEGTNSEDGKNGQEGKSAEGEANSQEGRNGQEGKSAQGEANSQEGRNGQEEEHRQTDHEDLETTPREQKRKRDEDTPPKSNIRHKRDIPKKSVRFHFKDKSECPPELNLGPDNYDPESENINPKSKKYRRLPPTCNKLLDQYGSDGRGIWDTSHKFDYCYAISQCRILRVVRNLHQNAEHPWSHSYEVLNEGATRRRNRHVERLQCMVSIYVRDYAQAFPLLFPLLRDYSNRTSDIWLVWNPDFSKADDYSIFQPVPTLAWTCVQAYAVSQGDLKDEDVDDAVSVGAVRSYLDIPVPVVEEQLKAEMKVWSEKKGGWEDLEEDEDCDNLEEDQDESDSEDDDQEIDSEGDKDEIDSKDNEDDCFGR